jgi:hypothetical protein
VTREPGAPGPPALGPAGPQGRGGPGGPAGGRQHDRLLTICCYAALFLFGLLQALIGCFQYGRGPVPLAAIGFDLAILLTCAAGAWGMRTPGGGLMPGAGWFLTTLALATGTRGGSVVITNTTAGKWFLFGGAACTAAGCVLSYLRWSRAGLAGKARR